jgi:hypothetical protein
LPSSKGEDREYYRSDRCSHERAGTEAMDTVREVFRDSGLELLSFGTPLE